MLEISTNSSILQFGFRGNFRVPQALRHAPNPFHEPLSQQNNPRISAVKNEIVIQEAPILPPHRHHRPGCDHPPQQHLFSKILYAPGYPLPAHFSWVFYRLDEDLAKYNFDKRIDVQVHPMNQVADRPANVVLG